MNRKILILFCFMFVAILFLTSCNNQENKTLPEENEDESIVVLTQKAEYRNFESALPLNGKVEPIEQVDVTPKMSGRVKSVNFNLGDSVKAGQVLFTLEDTDIINQVKQAEAAVNVARVNLERAGGASVLQQQTQQESAIKNAEIALKDANDNYERTKAIYESDTQIITAQIEYDNAKTGYDSALLSKENALISYDNAQNNYNNAKNNFDRTKQLYEAGAISKQEFESVELGLKTAESAVKAAESGIQAAETGIKTAESRIKMAEQQLETVKINNRQALDAAETRVNTAKEQYELALASKELTENSVNPENIRTAQAQLAQTEASYQAALSQLENTVVKAPISGIIQTKNVNVGQIVAAGGMSCAMIVNIQNVTVNTEVPENSITKIYEGQRMDVVIPTVSSDILTGEIVNISPTASTATRAYLIKISIPNPNSQYKGGMFAEIKIPTEKVDNVLAVPINAVILKDDMKLVYINEDGVAKQREVTTGTFNNEYIEIVSGLNGEDEVIVKGQTFLQDGKKVRLGSDESSFKAEDTDLPADNSSDEITAG